MDRISNQIELHTCTARVWRPYARVLGPLREHLPACTDAQTPGCTPGALSLLPHLQDPNARACMRVCACLHVCVCMHVVCQKQEVWLDTLFKKSIKDHLKLCKKDNVSINYQKSNQAGTELTVSWNKRMMLWLIVLWKLSVAVNGDLFASSCWGKQSDRPAPTNHAENQQGPNLQQQFIVRDKFIAGLVIKSTFLKK